MLGSGLLLLAGNLGIGLLMLARNILIANFISVEHYGIAMTFAITMTLIEVAFNLMADVYVVKAEDGDDPKTLPVLHTVMAVRGFLNAALLYLVAPYIAALFKTPDLVWAYQMLGAISVLRGFTHLDMFRQQRHGKFRPKVMVEAGAFIASLVAAYIGVVMFGDFRAMLAALLTQWAVFLLLSHFVAERRFSFGWSNEVWRGLLIFGWPLMLNAWLVYPIVNGDRIIVGNQLGPVVLGWFSAAFMLAQTPSMLLNRVQRTLFLPMITQPQGAERADAHRISQEVALFLGLAFAVGTLIAGPFFLTALYGDRYLQAVPILLWLGLIFGIRLARTGLQTSVMAEGETKVVLHGSILRVMALPLAWLLLERGGTVAQLMVLLFVAELASYLITLWLARKYASCSATALVASGALCGGIILVMQLTDPVILQNIRFDAMQWGLLLLLGAILIPLPSLRGWIRRELAARKATV